LTSDITDRALRKETGSFEHVIRRGDLAEVEEVVGAVRNAVPVGVGDDG
jgi:hypothetical protein